MTDVIEGRLIDLRERMDVEVGERLVGDVMSRVSGGAGAEDVPRMGRGRPRWVAIVGFAAIAAAVIVVVAVPAPRRTVARWLGIGSTRIDSPPVVVVPSSVPPTGPAVTDASAGKPPTIELPVGSSTTDEPTATFPTVEPPTGPSTTDEPPATFPTSLRLGDSTSVAEAGVRTGLPVGLAPTLGEPAGVYVVTPPDSGQVVCVYPPSSTLPASPVAGVGALLSTMPGTIDDGLFVKIAASGTRVEELTFRSADGAEAHAIWLSGEPHSFVFEDRDGVPVFDTLRLATNTLLWQVGDVTFRLEAELDRATAIRIAASVVTQS